MNKILLFVLLFANSITAFAECSDYLCSNVLIQDINKGKRGLVISVETDGDEKNLACSPYYNQLFTQHLYPESSTDNFLFIAWKYGLPTDIYLHKSKNTNHDEVCEIKAIVVKELRKDAHVNDEEYQKDIPPGMDFTKLLLPHAYVERQKLSKAKDERIKLSFSQDDKDQMMIKMKQWYETTKMSLRAISEEKWGTVAILSELTGKIMINQSSLTADVKEHEQYNVLNQASHEAFSELGVHARSGDLEAFQAQINQLMQLCVECHSSYRFD